MPRPIDNHQASLALTQFIPLQGIFPGQLDPGEPQRDPGGIPLGSIRTFAGNFAPGGSDAAEGQPLPLISQNFPLFALLGTMYGGNGINNFALPDLDGRTMIGVEQLDNAARPAIGSSEITLSHGQLPDRLGGSSQPFGNYQPSLPVTYLIREAGVFPSEGGGTGGVDFIGQVVPFAGNFVPAGFLQAAGQVLQIADHATLFQLIGTIYGGDGVTTFQLPDLRDRTIVGASSDLPLGATDGQGLATLSDANLPVSFGGSGQPVDNHEPSLALKYLIATEGIFPPNDGSGSVDPSQQYLGEVVAFAGNFVPAGWEEAAGQLLPLISQNFALFSLLGTQYGGNGTTNFALPDLRDRTAVGTGDAAHAGDMFCSNDAIVLPINIPVPGHDFSNDGNSDILWQSNDGTVAAWLMDGTTATTVTAAGSFNPGPTWHVKGSGDFDGDGKADIIWQGDNGTASMWLMDGPNTTFVGAVGPFNPGPTWHIEGTGDFNGDGKSDILWQHDNGLAAMWLMDGTNATFVGAVGSNPGPNWEIKGTGDFNGDGKSDLVWQGNDGTAAVWLMDGTNVVSATAVGSNPGPTWEIKGTGDFNGDGKSDIIWQGDNGTASMWLMDGTNVVSVSVAGSFNPGSDWHVII